MSYDDILWLMYLCVIAGIGIGSGIVMLGTIHTLENRVSLHGVLSILVGVAILYKALSLVRPIAP